jgi:hypothetical protein
MIVLPMLVTYLCCWWSSCCFCFVGFSLAVRGVCDDVFILPIFYQFVVLLCFRSVADQILKSVGLHCSLESKKAALKWATGLTCPAATRVRVEHLLSPNIHRIHTTRHTEYTQHCPVSLLLWKSLTECDFNASNLYFFKIKKKYF